MSFSLTGHRTSARAFTLSEVLVAAALAGAVSLIVMSVLVSTMRLSSQNVVTNISHFRARQTLDRLDEIVRFAQESPDLITQNGTLASGNTADGILVKNTLSGPYSFKNANGQADADIPQGAKSFVVQFAAAAGVRAPTVGDYFSVVLSTHPQLEVTAVGAVTTSGGVSKTLITTKQALPEVAKPGSYTVTAYCYRREAYIFAQAGSSWDLRHYPMVTADTNYASASSYHVLGRGFQKLNNQAWFTISTANGTQSTWFRGVARSSNHAEFAETKTGRNTLTSMPIQIRLWNYNAPPPPP